jgi:hypothetical protein
VSTRLIVDHWEEMQRLASSIRHGVTPASVLMRKLASYPRQNQLAQALAEVGKVEQTVHLLESYGSEAVRRRIERRLDRHESANALGRALFFGRQGVMRDRVFQDQMHRASCLVIVMAAIIAWNMVYLEDAITTLRANGEDIPDALISHIAPLGWRLMGRAEKVRSSAQNSPFSDSFSHISLVRRFAPGAAGPPARPRDYRPTAWPWPHGSGGWRYPSAG